MDTRKNVEAQSIGEECDTIYYPGNRRSQTQVLKYIGQQKIWATTGELMWCEGRNGFAPLKVIYKPFLGPEIADVNLYPFDTYLSRLNPIKQWCAWSSWIENWQNGYHFTKPLSNTQESVSYHTPIISQISIGQETDIKSYEAKYNSWLQKKDKTKHFISWGVSRGGPATFCALAKSLHPEVKLVILEAAFDNLETVISNSVMWWLRSDYLTKKVTSAACSGLSFFTQFRSDGPSPLKSLESFPEKIPVVFITSKKDTLVPYHSTKNLADQLAARGKNDVYLLTLENSTHPNYMFDDQYDRDKYETFIHAIYEKYGLKHDVGLALKGRCFIKEATLCELNLSDDKNVSCIDSKSTHSAALSESLLYAVSDVYHDNDESYQQRSAMSMR